MAGKDLTAAEKAFLVLLMAENREVSNAELNARYDITLTGTARKTLNDQKLVESTKVGRGLVHVLTDQGWARCKEELVAPYVKGTGPAFPALHALLGAVDRYLKDSQRSLPDLFIPSERIAELETPAQPTPTKRAAKPKPDLSTRVVAAYEKKAAGTNGWVKIADLRVALSRAAKRPEIDAALIGLADAKRIILIPEENQQTLTRRDRDAALLYGGEPNHLIRIEAS